MAMPSDPGLTNDTCIFMEAIPGDGGNQNPNDVWWLSPDITLKGPVSGLENADAGQTNTIKIKFRRKPAASGCSFPGDESITVQAWVANPSLVMAPRVRGSAARVGFIGSAIPPEGGNHVQQIDWTLPAVSVTPTPLFDNPQKPGPKCLVAICYPDSLAPSTSKFFVPGDQHVAQHNLCIMVAPGTSIKLEVNTFNPAAPSPPATPLGVKLRAVLDLLPSNFVKKMVLSRVQTLPGFQQIRNAGLPQGFAFDLTGLLASDIVDKSHTSGPVQPPHPNPSYEAKVELSGEPTKIKFLANLKGAQPGEVCIFHLTQTFKDLAQGGITLAVLKT
jgi:hypothetical protein